MDENPKSANEIADDLDELADDITGDEGMWFWEKMYRRRPEFY